MSYKSQHNGRSAQQSIVKYNGIYLMRPWLCINSIWYHVIAFKSIKQAGGLEPRQSFPWLRDKCQPGSGLTGLHRAPEAHYGDSCWNTRSLASNNFITSTCASLVSPSCTFSEYVMYNQSRSNTRSGQNKRRMIGYAVVCWLGDRCWLAVRVRACWCMIYLYHFKHVIAV